MIPYFPQPVFHAGSVTISAFRILTAAALLTGYSVTLWRAENLKLDPAVSSRLYVFAVLGGLIAGHAASLWINGGDAPREWIMIWKGQSAAGLGIGALLALAAGCIFLRLTSKAAWAHLNSLAFAFPFAWTLARAGCALAHDHIGRRTDSFLAVRFPDGPRFDLGLLECLAAAALAIAFFAARRTRRNFFFPALIAAAILTRAAVSGLRG